MDGNLQNDAGELFAPLEDGLEEGPLVDARYRTIGILSTFGVIALGAMFMVHLKAGFFMPNGYEFVLALLASAVTLAITGAGAFSLDARLAARQRA